MPGKRDHAMQGHTGISRVGQEAEGWGFMGTRAFSVLFPGRNGCGRVSMVRTVQGESFGQVRGTVVWYPPWAG